MTAQPFPDTRLSRDRRAVFLDKDGTLVEDLPYNVDPSLLRFTPRAIDGLRLLQSQGYLLIVASNQPGIALGRFNRAALDRLHAALTQRLADEGITLHGFHACPHAASADPKRPNCLCRKPASGLLRRGARAHQVNLSRSWMVGDILNDVEAGRRAGCRTVLLDVGHETQWLMSPLREPHFRCKDLLDAAQVIVATDQQATPSRPQAPRNAADLASHEA